MYTSKVDSLHFHFLHFFETKEIKKEKEITREKNYELIEAIQVLIFHLKKFLILLKILISPRLR